MNQILRCDWLPEWARWIYLVRSGPPTASRKEIFPRKPYNKPLLTKLARSRGLGIGLVLCVFMDLDPTLVHKHAKNKQTNKKRTWPISRHLDLTLGQ